MVVDAYVRRMHRWCINAQGVWPIAVHYKKWKWKAKAPMAYAEKKETKTCTIYRFERVPMECETDIFKLLELAYVPWWMRGATVEK